MELNTQDMLLSGDSQQLRRREQRFQWGSIVCRPLEENASKNEKPKLGHSGLKIHPTCGVNTPCKQCVRYHAVEKEEGRKEEERRRKKGERRRKDGSAGLMEASLTGVGGQSLAWSHLRSASSSATEEPATQERLQIKEKFTSYLKHQKFTVLTSACDMNHIGRNLLGVAPTPGEVIQQPHLHLEVGEHLNNVNVKQERFNRHPAEGSQVEKLQEQGNCDTGGLNGEKKKK